MKKLLCLLLVFASISLQGAASKATEPEVYEFESVELKPLVQEMPAPIYPADFAASEKVGSATIEFVITPKGRVSEGRVVEASESAFGDAALRSVLKAKFKPGKMKGKAVFVRMTLPITFDSPAKPKN